VIGDWGKLSKEDFHNVYSSPSNQVKKDEIGRACSKHVENRNAYWNLVGKPEGKKPLGRPRHRW
jgi:hypothetical protein